jgi:predicted DNA-binding transcriptional regulator YafY
MLRLLSLLQTHRYWSGDELAGRLEVSPRTLRRDVDRLRELGYPVDAVRGVAGGYQLQAGAVLPPLLLDDEEAVAIAVSLRSAAGGLVAGIEEPSVRALTKVVQVMPAGLRRRADALQNYTVPVAFGGPRIDVTALTAIAQACRDDERIRFRYTRYDGTVGDRLVEPHRLVTYGRRWYLVGWDAEGGGWRLYRIDRLTDPVRTGARFRPRELPGGDAAQYVRDRLAAVPRKYRVNVIIHAPADTVEQVISRWGDVEPIDGSSCRMLISTDSLEWPALILGQLGADFEVVAPPELRDHLRTLAELFLRG